MNGLYKDPEREDLPSVSKFASYALCEIKYQLELLAPPEKPSKDAAAGADGHSVLFGNPIELPLDQQDTVDACREQEAELVDGIAAGADIIEVHREERLFYRDRQQKIFTGQPDMVTVLDDEYRTAIAPDYKLGFLRAPLAPVNLQLRGQALIIWQNYGSKRVFGSIIQPRTDRWSEPVEYGLPELREAREEILVGLMPRIHSPEAKANPSAEACRWCAAKLFCKAAYKPSQHLVTHRKEMIQALDDPTLSRLGELALQANIISKTALEELKERVTERPDDFPAWYLQGTGSNSRINDALAAFESLSDLLSEDIREAKELFNAALETSLTDIVDMVRRHTGWSKRDARTEVERRLGALLIRKSKSPSLKRKEGWSVPVPQLEIEGVER